MPLTALDIVGDALAELGVKAQGETLSAAEGDAGLRKLNAMLDEWNATRSKVFAEVFLTFTLTPALSPHLIGPTGSTGLVVAQRPVTIDGAGMETVVGSGVYSPIDLRDALWDAVPSIPRSLFYNPTWPNGELYFWPIPSGASSVTLMLRMVLAQMALSTTFTLPPGYQKAITLTLAEECAASFGTQPKPSTVHLAAQARAAIAANNDPKVPIRTMDAGMPGGGGGYYNYLLGQ